MTKSIAFGIRIVAAVAMVFLVLITARDQALVASTRIRVRDS